MSWVNPRTWVGGETITAAKLNELRDSLKVFNDAWVAYTPTWTASTTNPTIGNGTLSGRYMKAGRLVAVEISVVGGSTTNWGSGAYSLTLPFAARSSSVKRALQGSLYDSSLGNSVQSVWPIAGILGMGSTTSFDLAGWPVTAGNSYRFVNATNHFTLATGDRIDLAGVYEAAS